MAKNAKKGTTTQGKPITDFFTLASKPHTQPRKSRVSPPMSSPASSSQDIRATPASENIGVSNKSKVASFVSKPRIDSSFKAHGRQFLDGSENSSSSKTRPPFTSSAAISSLKRVGSPDLQAHANPLHNKKGLSDNAKTNRRRGKFDSDSDIEMPNTIVYVNSTPNPKSRKKARLSPPGDSRVGLLVPSSQSDEENLVIIKKKAPLPTLTRENNESMEISTDNNLISELTTRATSTDCHGWTPFSTSHSAGQMPTPITDHSFSAPPPIPLDPASKTAQIIAQIKERAYAKAHSSPEVTPLEFNDDLDDSSDEDSFLTALPFVTRPASSRGNTVADAFEDTSIKRTSRYSLRSRSMTWSSSNSSPSSELIGGSPSRKHSSPPKVIKDRTGQEKKTDPYDPFDALLKEKKLGEKSGKGSDAFRRAETTTDKFDEYHLIDGVNEDGLDNWNDQDAAASAVRDRNWLINRPLTPESNRGNGDDLRLDDADRRKLFGEDGGKAIMGILEHDKIAKREVLNQQVPGLRFWSLSGAHSTAMVVDEAPSIEICVTSPLICLLKKSIQHGDFCRAALILDMDLLLTFKPIEQSAIVQYLCELVLASQRSLLSEPASRALENHWRSNETTCGLSFSQVLTGVQRLGADVAVLSSQNWLVSSIPYAEDVTTELREDFIRRLIILANICARARKFRTEEAPDLVLLLLLIGADISTSHDLQLDIIQSINLICNSIANEDVGFEVVLCSKVLNCIAGHEPVNKARLIALLSAGSGSTKRIASFIAYCVIVDGTTAIAEIYSDLPPLDAILEQLHPSPSLPSSKFSLSETTNYLDLGHYISILAIALSNVRGYVTEERRSSKEKHSQPLPSPHKRVEGPRDLQLVYMALETLHSNISDSKALHLERSRTKAIIKGLSMYIHYQRDYWLKHDRGPQSKKLLHYFKKAP